MPPINPPLTFSWTLPALAPFGEATSVPSLAESTRRELPGGPFSGSGTAVLGPHWPSIEGIAKKTPGLAPPLCTRLANAYFSADTAGSLTQLYTAKAIEYLFLLSPYLREDEAPETFSLFHRLRCLLTDPHAPPAAFHETLRSMENGPRNPSLDAVQALQRAGQHPDTIASRLVGSRHTAFLKDPSVARALVSLLVENGDDLDPWSERRRHSRVVLLEEIGRRIDAGEPLTAAALRNLIEKTGFEIPSAVSILIKPGHEFDEKVALWGEAVGAESAYGCRVTFFRRAKGKGEIWVRDVEPSSRNESVRQWRNRLIALPHETEHSLQEDFSDRLVSETLAGLAEQRWRMRNSDIDAWTLAGRLGLTLVQYLKLTAMWSYRIPAGS